MNILIDTSPLQNESSIRGIGRYTKELLSSLRTIKSPHTFYTNEDVADTSIDLIHYPFFDFFFPTLPFFKKAKTVVTIHDVIPLLFPKHYPRGIRGTINLFRQKLALRGVAHVITDSESSKRDIIDHLHIKPENISVVYLAANEAIKKPVQSVQDEVRKRYSLPKNFALYVGDINYNKNLPFLIRSVKKIPKLSLVLVGKAMNNTAIPEGRAIHKTISLLGMEKRVKLIDSVSGDASSDLSSMYSLATVYVQPSLYEGFGLPVLEAMQCRTPVVCARAGSLPEVAGDAASYFHPMDEEDCANAIQKVLRFSQKQRSTAVRKGVDQAAKFSWKKVATQTLSVYESIGGRG